MEDNEFNINIYIFFKTDSVEHLTITKSDYQQNIEHTKFRGTMEIHMNQDRTGGNI